LADLALASTGYQYHKELICTIDMTTTPEDKLTTASANGNVLAVRELLMNGAQVNGMNSFGHSAVQVSHIDAFHRPTKDHFHTKLCLHIRETVNTI